MKTTAYLVALVATAVAKETVEMWRQQQVVTGTNISSHARTSAICLIR